MPHNMKQKIESYLRVTTVLGFYGDSKRYRCVPTHNTIREALPALVHSIHTLNTTQIQHDKFPVTLLLCWVGSYGDSKRYRCVPTHKTIREVLYWFGVQYRPIPLSPYIECDKIKCQLSNHCMCWVSMVTVRDIGVYLHITPSEKSHSALMFNTGPSYIEYHTTQMANCWLSNHCAGFLW